MSWYGPVPTAFDRNQLCAQGSSAVLFFSTAVGLTMNGPQFDAIASRKIGLGLGRVERDRRGVRGDDLFLRVVEEARDHQIRSELHPEKADERLANRGGVAGRAVMKEHAGRES